MDGTADRARVRSSVLSSQLAGKRQGRFSAPGAKRSIMVVDETNAGAPLFLDPYLPYLNLSISTIEASTCIINQYTTCVDYVCDWYQLSLLDSRYDEFQIYS